MNQEALTSPRRHWTITREALAFTASVLLFPLGWRKSRKKTARAADQRTVVFIHGYLANRSSFLPLAGYLAAKGAADASISSAIASAGLWPGFICSSSEARAGSIAA